MNFKWHDFSTGRYKVFTTFDVDGMCFQPDSLRETSAYPYEIWIKPGLRGNNRMETLIHEAAHAEMPKLSEDEVDALAKHFTDLLWRDGYRRTEEKRRGGKSKGSH